MKEKSGKYKNVMDEWPEEVRPKIVTFAWFNQVLLQGQLVSEEEYLFQ